MQKKHIKIVSFVMGLALLVFGFFVDHLKEIPLVERILSPRSYFVNLALTRLDDGELINREDPAFNYILNICPPSGIDLNTITALSKRGTVFDMTKAETRNYFGIYLRFGNKETKDSICTSDVIQDKIKNGTYLLILGLIISIVGFLIK